MMTFLHSLARALGRHAERVLAVVHPEQGRAIAAEIAHVDDPLQAVMFASGGVLAAWRRRFSAPAAGIVAARFSIGLAAGLLGHVHLQIAGMNLCRKVSLMTGGEACLAKATPYVVGVIEQHSLAHWSWKFAVLGGMGALHVAAAAAMMLGATKAVSRIAVAVAVLAIAMPGLGAGGLTLPVIYLAQIGLMALAAWGLARLWRWDEQRLAGR
ncbi:hypothetical protein [Caulobacter sp. RHG1]|uniref:hypothetical protein n=1 Tax=Caulobacter sp. (strain RHG1) TaxID=2545762 RepID=UPI001556556E|nr:hypothetical protein [Caulobacter sp. RHG1]NQE64676.1 hypothetical protein [Caulobacter sp. RHG1]